MIEPLFNPKSIVPADREDRAQLVQDFISTAIASWCASIFDTRIYTNSIMNTWPIFLIPQARILKKDGFKHTHMVEEIF